MRVFTSYFLFMIVACCHGDGSQLYLDHHASGIFLEIDLYVIIMSQIHTPRLRNIHVPATSAPHKMIRRRKPTINTSPMIVPTAIPAVAPGDKLGRVVVTGGKRVTVGAISPGDKLGRTVLGGRAVTRERNTSIRVSEISCQLACGLDNELVYQ